MRLVNLQQPFINGIISPLEALLVPQTCDDDEDSEFMETLSAVQHWEKDEVLNGNSMEFTKNWGCLTYGG